jgi:hypothetical protein
VLTDFTKNNIRSELGGLIVGQVDTYQFLERIPLSAKEVITTLAKTYIGLPLSWFVPMILAAGAAMAFKRLDIIDDPIPFLITGSAIGLLNFLVQSVRAIRRARGWQPNVVTG